MSSIEKSVATVKSEIRSLLQTNVCLTKDGIKFGLQVFLGKKFSDKEISSVYQVAMMNALKAEQKCSGSGRMVLQLFANEEIVDHDASSQNTRQSFSSRLREDGLSERETSLIITACDLVTLGGKVLIKKSRNLSSYVEVTEGNHFKFKSILGNQADVSRPRVLCIDGFIESVSEIHHLLESLSEKKIPLLIFSRGYSDDVLSTLAANNRRGVFEVHAFKVPFDQNSANSLVDIAVVSGGDVVSSLRGDLISSVTLDSIPECERASITRDAVFLFNSKSRNRVKEHLLRVTEKAEGNELTASLYADRMSALSGRQVTIYLPDDISYTSSSHKIDVSLRKLRDEIVLRKSSSEVAREHLVSLKNSLEQLGCFVC
jgi:hypothetical protein